VACHPASGIIYQTEDRYDSLIYRFIPTEPGKLVKGGKLQALRIKDKPRFDIRNWGVDSVIKPGEALAVEWVDIQNPTSPDDDLRYQGYFERGCTRFARAEGIYYGNDAFYITCTNGGVKRKGQIWKYTPSPAEGTVWESANPGVLELFVEPNDGSLVENCDNLCVAPWGDLIVCEDGISPQFIVGIRQDGSIYKIARTTISELAGACFSPDGTTLFVNIQSPGITLAIIGPWREYAAKARV
jgi:secreted PhoX family phosphatase